MKVPNQPFHLDSAARAASPVKGGVVCPLSYEFAP